MIRTSFSGVCVGLLVLPFEIVFSSVEKQASEDELLDTNDNNTLSTKKVLSNNGCESSHDVAFSVDYDLFVKHLE